MDALLAVPSSSVLRPGDVWLLEGYRSHGPGAVLASRSGGAPPAAAELDVGRDGVAIAWAVEGEPWVSHVTFTWTPDAPADLLRGEVSMGGSARPALRVAITAARMPGDGRVSTPAWEGLPGWGAGWTLPPATAEQSCWGGATWIDEGDPPRILRWLLHPASDFGRPDAAIPVEPALFGEGPLRWRWAGDSDSVGGETD